MNVLNVVGNAVLVYGFHMGVAGVALSVPASPGSWRRRSCWSSSTAAATRCGIHGLLRFRFEPPIMGQILRIGVPNGLENSFFQLGRVLLVSLISTFGTAQTAANAVANNIDNFGVIPGQAMGLALITVVGQCVGAEEWEQVRFYTKKLVKFTYLCTWGLNAVLLLGLPLILEPVQPDAGDPLVRRGAHLDPQRLRHAVLAPGLHHAQRPAGRRRRAGAHGRLHRVHGDGAGGGQLPAGPPLRPGGHRRVDRHGGGLDRPGDLLCAPRPEEAVAGAPLKYAA